MLYGILLLRGISSWSYSLVEGRDRPGLGHYDTVSVWCVLGEEAGPHIQGWVGFMVPITESDLSPGLQG